MAYDEDYIFDEKKDTDKNYKESTESWDMRADKVKDEILNRLLNEILKEHDKQ